MRTIAARGYDPVLQRFAKPSPMKAASHRKQLLAAELCSIADADTYVWSIHVGGCVTLGDGIPTTMFDGGWKSEEERLRFLGLILRSAAIRAAISHLTALADSKHTRTALRQDLVAVQHWEIFSRELRKVGFGESLLSVYPFEESGISCLGLYRRLGKPSFSEHERALVNLVFQNIDSLHRQETTAGGGEAAAKLSPRQVEVLNLLLQGNSQKAAAKELKISPHTVTDYVKGIYRSFGVHSRGELLAHFITAAAESSALH